jgi:hypothetical protein
MTVKAIAPYGDWASPISINTITAKSRGLSDPRVGVGHITLLLVNSRH